jgi:putative addiction module component (TIGR02574 family)
MSADPVRSEFEPVQYLAAVADLERHCGCRVCIRSKPGSLRCADGYPRSDADAFGTSPSIPFAAERGAFVAAGDLTETPLRCGNTPCDRPGLEMWVPDAAADAPRYVSSMGSQALRILTEAMSLSLEERAELATELLASLDGEPDGGAQGEWVAEITRRAERARAGQTVGIDSDAVHAKVRSILERE